MIVKLLAEHHLEFLSLKGGCRGSSESTHVKMSHCWKSHALAQSIFSINSNQTSTTKIVLFIHTVLSYKLFMNGDVMYFTKSVSFSIT